jgi:diguanylate cyclase (GGDEF)-like protein/PAS domain S-box-containing protein
VVGIFRVLQLPLARILALFGVLFTLALVYTTWQNTLDEHENLFTAQSEAVREQLVERAKATDELIIGLTTLVNSATRVDADQFRLFSEGLLRRHSYLLSTAYLPHIVGEERQEFERSRREAGFPGFSISERSGAQYRAAKRHESYFPILFVEPFEPETVVMIGFNVLSEQGFIEAAQAAIDIASASASTPRLVDRRVWGYWLFAAIYAGKGSPATVPERRAAVTGLIALRINGEQLLAESVGSRPLSAYLRIYPAGHAEAFDLAHGGQVDEQPNPWAVKTYMRIVDLVSGGQRFELELSHAVTWREVNYLPVTAAFAFGALITVLLIFATQQTVLRARQLEQRNIEIEQVVTEKTAELALEKERAQVTLASIGDAVITTDAHGRVEYLNQAAEELTGWSRREARGRELAEVLHVRPAKNPIAVGGSSEPPLGDSVLTNRSGRELAIDQTVAPIRGRQDEVLGAVVVFRDVSQQRRLAEEMSYQASHDALTGLYNRRAFEDRLGHLLAVAKAQGVRHALLYLDLDQFKIVNDICGHSAGDQLLRQISALLRQDVRQTDVLARLGGDELGVLLQYCPQDEAEQIADKLLKLVNDFRFAWKERIFTISASIGLVSFGSEAESAASILSAADAACYAAKDKGRNRVLLYQADDVELTQRRSQMHWATDLKRALAEDKFELFAQPIVALEGGNSVVAQQEILLRLRGADGTLVPPGAFLPAAERYGLMPEIDRFVVHKTLGWLARHKENRNLATIYNINISGQSLSDAPFFQFVMSEIERSGVAPEKLCFEITETAAVATLDSAMRVIQALKDKGIRFSLDDFGSGWSSFVYLKNLPVDFLKIDGSLVRDMAEDVLDEAMVRAINEIGHIMGIATIAEFVESDAVLARAKKLGIDFAQGYAIARPTPIDEHLEETAISRAG